MTKHQRFVLLLLAGILACTLLLGDSIRLQDADRKLDSQTRAAAARRFSHNTNSISTRFIDDEVKKHRLICAAAAVDPIASMVQVRVFAAVGERPSCGTSGAFFRFTDRWLRFDSAPCQTIDCSNINTPVTQLAILLTC